MARIDLHGTAELRDQGVYKLTPELFSSSGGVNGVLLGTNDSPEFGTMWIPGSEQGHAMTFGATRSGKGVSAIIPALLTYAGSMVVIDPKGENAWVTAERRRKIGQRVVILDPWNEVTRRYGGGHQVEQVTRFNPLAVLDPKSPDFGDEVAAVADALITQSSSAETHWADSAREMVAGLVAAYVEARPGKATLRDVRWALLISQDDFGKLIEYFEAETPDGLGCRKLAGYKVGSREVDSIRSNAKTQTAFLDSEQLCDGLVGEDQPFDLSELATGKVTLYLVLPLDRLQTHGRWLRLILTLAIRIISRQASPPQLPVMFLLDEFGTVGRLSMIEQAFGLMAGIGIRVWAFLQDLNQLKRDYPQSWETFIANSSILQVLNARDTTTSNYFSDYLGTSTSETISVATQQARDKLFGDPNASRITDQVHGRPIFFPEEIRRFSANWVLIFMVGKGAIQQHRIAYYGFPFFQGLYRHLPAFPPPIPKLTVEQATAKIKAAGHTMKSKMLGGWSIANPKTGKSTTAGNDADLITYAETLP